MDQQGEGDGEQPSSRWGERQCLSVQVVADVLRVRPLTVQRMLRHGELDGFQVGPRGLWRVTAGDLHASVERSKAEAHRADPESLEGN